MLFTPSDREVIARLSHARKQSFTALVDEIKRDTRRPDLVDSEGVKRRHYYEGKDEVYFRSFLTDVYPEGMAQESILPVTMNYVKVFANTESDVYRVAPERKARTEGQTRELERLVRMCGLPRKLPEAERRSKVGRTIFVRLFDDPLSSRLRADLFWPHDVWVVAHPAAPESVEHALVVLLHLRDGTMYELWTRGAEGWRVEHLDLDAGAATPILEGADPYKYPGQRIPICAMHAGLPSGTPYLDDDADLIRSANTINMFWTELTHIVRYQGHTPLVYKGTSDAPMSGGPAAMFKVMMGETVESLHLSPQIESILEVTKQHTRAEAVTRRQPPSAYDTEPATNVSGASRRIENAVADDARRERVEDMREFEERDLLPILVDVAQTFGYTEQAFVDPQFEFRAAALPDFEDPNEKTARVLAMVSAGVISRARAGVLLGEYATEEDANSAQEGLEPTPQAPPAQDMGMTRV